MTQRKPPDSVGDADDWNPQEHSGGWWFAVVPALTLLVGLVLGGVLVGIADDDSPSPDESATSSPPPADPSPSPDVSVVVPRECLEAAETVRQATALIRDGVGAVRDFRPGELVTLLDELEDLDAQAREQAAACEEVDVSDTP